MKKKKNTSDEIQSWSALEGLRTPRGSTSIRINQNDFRFGLYV